MKNFRVRSACIALCLLSLSVVSFANEKYYRENWSKFAKAPEKLAAFKRGIAAMKARKPSDPKSWFFQAAIHGVSEDAIKQATLYDPGVATVDQQKFWNQCPHFGESSANFLIWHRAYLMYFERILRSESKDPNLSLPYWDYTGTDRSFPREFAMPRTRNPLFASRREQAFMVGLYELSNRAVNTEVMNEEYFFGTDELSGFAGGVSDAAAGTKGKMEQSPHDLIHFAVGGAIGDRGGLMSSVLTAATDPIFWIHHSNIDRLWAKWDCAKGKKWGAVPTSAWLNEKPWNFYDEKVAIQNNSRIHYLRSFQPSRVTYDTDVVNCRRLTDSAPTPGKPISPRVNISEKSFVASRTFTLGLSDAAFNPSATEAKSVSIPVQNVKSLTGDKSVNNLLLGNVSSRKVYLEFTGMKFRTPPSVGFEVYVNLPPDQISSKKTKYYAGTIALFGVGHGHSGHKVSAQTFDITDAVEGLEAFENVKVSIVPFDLLKPRSDETPRLLRDGSFEIKLMKVELLESNSLF